MIQIYEPEPYASSTSYRITRTESGDLEVSTVSNASSRRPSDVLTIRTGLLSEFRDLIESLNNPESSSRKELEDIVGEQSEDFSDYEARTNVGLLDILDEFLEPRWGNSSSSRSLDHLHDPLVRGVLSGVSGLDSFDFTPCNSDQRMLLKLGQRLGLEGLRDFTQRRFDHLSPSRGSKPGINGLMRLGIACYPREFSDALNQTVISWPEDIGFPTLDIENRKLVLPLYQRQFNIRELDACFAAIPQSMFPGSDLKNVLMSLKDSCDIDEDIVTFSIEALLSIRSALSRAVMRVSTWG